MKSLRMTTKIAATLLLLTLTVCANRSRDTQLVTASAPPSRPPYGGKQLHCGPPFGSDVFKTAPGAEEADSPPAQALRKFLAEDPDGQKFLPRSGYRLLYEGRPTPSYPQTTSFAAGEPPNLQQVELRLTDGSWKVAGFGGCKTRPYRENLVNGNWALDPDAPPPVPESTLLHVLANDIQCAGGASPHDRMGPPEVEYLSDVIIITFWAETLPAGTYTCPGHPPVKRTVTLTEPLGARRLLDGGIFPAQEPSLDAVGFVPR